MTSQSSQSTSNIEFFPPPSEKLREKVFTGNEIAPAVDPAAVARAERTLAEIADTCREGFEQAIAEIRKDLSAPVRGDAGRQLFAAVLRSAMEIKGLCGALQDPLVVDIAISLVELLDRCRKIGARERTAIQLHLDALEAAGRKDAGIADQTRTDATALLGKLNSKIGPAADR